jgi:hypothetical protein
MNKAKNTNNKGITLITLSITIIVLLILAGITIETIWNDAGIISNAIEEKKAMEIEKEIDDIQNDEGTSNIVFYLGEEVTVGTEPFYVLYDSDNTKSEVILFAKYNLDTDGNAQVSNAEYGDTSVKFSSNNNWIDGLEKWDDLNNCTALMNDTESANYKANYYATNNLKGSSGRLLSYCEASGLQCLVSSDTTGKIAEMLWGEANEQSEGNFLKYWIGTYLGEDYIAVIENVEEHHHLCYGDSSCCGVRPVVTVSKSLVTKIN